MSHANPKAGPTCQQYYEYLSKQIEREDGLINTRITWMLTFEGILFAALAVVADKEKVNAEVYAALKYTLPLVGLAVGLLALLAVTAAVLALKELKAHWPPRAFPDAQLHYPRPFGARNHHLFGIFYSQGLPIVIVIAWLYVLTVFHSTKPGPAPQKPQPPSGPLAPRTAGIPHTPTRPAGP